MPSVVDANWLFIKSCQDLVKRSKSPDLYDKLRMAGILHQLLVGKHALAQQVNQQAQRKLEFWYREPRVEDASAWSSALGFDASNHRAGLGETRRSGLDEFLASRVVWFGEWFSVEQFIKIVAHVYGGHYNLVPEGLGANAYRSFQASVNTGGAGGAVPVALQEISGVTLRTLISLSEVAGAGFAKQDTAPVQADVKAEATGCPFGESLSLDKITGDK